MSSYWRAEGLMRVRIGAVGEGLKSNVGSLWFCDIIELCQDELLLAPALLIRFQAFLVNS